MSYEIKLRFRRFGYGTVRITGLSRYYIGYLDPKALRAYSVSGPQDLVHLGTQPESATISPCTITTDLDEIVCSMTDGLTRGPDKDVHVPSAGSQKYPSYNVDVVYL